MEEIDHIHCVEEVMPERNTEKRRGNGDFSCQKGGIYGQMQRTDCGGYF